MPREVDLERAPQIYARIWAATELAAEVATKLAAERLVKIVRGKMLDTGFRVSAPGEAPGIDTGALLASYQAWEAQGDEWAAGTDSKYAVPLEFGTVNMAARPHFRVSVEELNMTSIVAREVVSAQQAEARRLGG